MIGEAIKENGKVIVTGCMGVEEGNIRNVHPSVLAVTGPQQYEQVVNAVHEVVPPRQDHNPLIDFVTAAWFRRVLNRRVHECQCQRQRQCHQFHQFHDRCLTKQ